MTDMIERVAGALAEADGRDWNIGDLARARAAIEAMREPTDAMSEAGGEAAHRYADMSMPVWHAMIEAALTPAEAGSGRS